MFSFTYTILFRREREIVDLMFRAAVLRLAGFPAKSQAAVNDLARRLAR